MKPIENGAAWRTECQNAAGVCPVSSRPDRSVIVPEIMIGTTVPRFVASSEMAWIAALALSVSKIVSISNTSTDPSSNPRTCSVYAARRSSNVTARNPGSDTSGEIDAVRFVGPIAPATKRRRPSSRSAIRAASRAMAAPARLRS